MTKNLLDALKKVDTERNIHPCKVGKILARLDAGERKALDAALADREAWSMRVIAKALNDAGHQISPSAVLNHRNGDCRCG